jgi:hypothetical protein
MKTKILTIFSLAAIFVFGACRSADNANTANTANMNTNVNMTATTPMTNTAGAADPTAKANVESALRKAGYNDVMVDATANEITLRGTVAKGKLGEAVRIANESGNRRVNNQLTEK